MAFVRISHDPAVMGGKPCIRGLRITVGPVVGLIAVGSLVGGWLGAHYGRRLSPGALRAVIVVVGLIGLYRLLMV
jgi:uncharacterized protein (DUF433 family)